jgi:TolB protein
MIERMRRRLIVIALLALPLGGCGGRPAPPLRGTIAFMRGGDRSGVPQVAAIDADGSGFRVLARGQNVNAPLRWSPDGTKLVFTMFRGGSPGRLYVVNVDGSGLCRITDAKYEDDIGPAWSPDGRRLVFDAQGDGWTDVRVVTADGSDERRIAAGSYVTGNTATIAGGDAWSPDGRKIVYLDRRSHLALMTPDGSHRRRLKPPVYASGDAAWSPNGLEIVFNADDEIAVVSADGSGLRTIVSRGKSPVWSPDGQKIVFVRNGGVFVVNSDGSGLRKVGRSGDQPSWSPDGGWVVYASYRNGKGDVYVVKADGSDERQLTDTKLYEADPVWSPAG